MIEEIKNKLYAKVGVRSLRTRNITKHVFLSFIYKGGSIVFNFLMVPLTLKFLDNESYGVWLTLSSFIAWFSFFDIGLGNGLRNKFTEAKSSGNLYLVKAYVSSAYYTVGALCLSLIFLFVVINLYIDWTKIFNTSTELRKDLAVLMPIVFGFFCIQLVAKLIVTIYTADQKHSMQGKINFFTQLSALVLIWVLTIIAKNSLLLFGIAFSSLPTFILIGLNIIGFKKKYSEFKPNINFWKKKYVSDIFSLGVKFFLIQLSGIILFTTDNIIITQLYGPNEVVPYNIAFQYFSISSMIISIILVPYWSSITEAYVKNDYDWIKHSMKNLIKIALASILLLVIMIVLSPFVYRLWVGNKVNVPFELSILMALFFSLTIFHAPFTNFINGTGKLTLQLISVMLTALINIPLSIYLAKNFNMHASGVILATSLCLLPHVILCPIQYYKIINRKANGIWNS